MKYTVGTTSTIYPTANYNIKGTERTKHIFAGGQLIGTISGSGDGAVAHTVATDHLTGANVVTSASGLVEELADYYPYGEVRLDEKSGAFSEQRKYAGQELDTDTGLSYMSARYYSGKTGRFISQDPMALYSPDKLLGDPQSLNSYAYARNNPMRYVDPSGMFADTPWDIGNVIYDVGRIFKNTIEVNAGLANYGYGVLTGNQARQNSGMGQMSSNLGDLGSALVDTVLDAGATAIPFVPAGITKVDDAARLVNTAGDAAKVIKNVGKEEKYISKVDDIIPLGRQNHILYGDKTGGGHIFGAGKGKPEFPSSWSSSQIFHNAADLATDPSLTWIKQPRNGNFIVSGVRDGVNMSVVIDPAKSIIITAFPKIR